MGQVKRNYTREFRADAVWLVLDQERNVADVVRSLDVHVNTLHGWVCSAKEHGQVGPRRRSGGAGRDRAAATRSFAT